MGEVARRGLVKTAGLIVVSTIFISTFSIFGTSSYQMVFGEDTLPENSLIGSVSVSGLQPAEAKEKIESEIEAWQTTQRLSLHHDSENIKLPGELWNFQVNETVETMTASNTEEVPLLVTINTEVLTELIAELGINRELFSLPLLSEVLSGYASTLEKDEIPIDLANYYATSDSMEQLAESKVKGTSDLILVPKVVDSIKNVTIEPEQTFSLQELLREANVTDKATDSLNLFPSAILEVLLHTNFELIERHTSLNLPVYGEPGLNGVINMTNQDFKFYNPNQSSYNLEFKWEKDSIVVTLFGPTFPLTYKPIVNKEKLDPDTIIQYSEALSGNEKAIIQEGKEGYLITTYRETIDQDQRVINKEKLFEDFYSPIHRIEKKAYPEPPSDPITTDEDGNPMPETDSEGSDESQTDENGSSNDGTSNNSSQTDTTNGDKDSEDSGNSEGSKENEDQTGEGSEVIKGLEYQKEGE
ncbi:G5 domain-containing protein [Guptibacillus hwajinpoensis]|uniref:G5 domain-containing protein n=1 Tax=Guptibacillus hwajinpoensis TaxID=208199 RepID=A0ABU0JWI2_9BACL|nr:G5 domain-containing protein [Alkalihalobacillus hemicentroti]MDQ0481424.1 hypothetical protein [Alkalihalobacillus hemicentroti]